LLRVYDLSMRVLVFTLCLTLLAACSYTPRFHSQVTRFHSFATPQPPVGSFVIQPQGDQAASLEYKTYSQYIAAELSRYGLTQVAAKPATYGVRFSYHSDAPRTEIEVDRFSLGAGVGTGSSHWRYGGAFRDPFYGPSIYSRVVQPHQMEIALVDLKAPGTPTVFEARAVSEGKSVDFSTISRCMVQAIFADFPGTSGTSTRVTLPSEACITGIHAN
jgi:hypothetical protein